jgi:hypothetical protein
MKQWLLRIGLAAYLGIEGARIAVYWPDWWAEFYKFWIIAG